MNIGITGASGFLGSYILEYMSLNKKNKIVAITRSPSSVNIEANNISWIIGDLNSRKTCENFIKNLDVIIHFAYTNSPLNSDEDIISDASLNITPLLNLLEVIKKLKKKVHIIYPSSGGAVYGYSKDKVPFKETDPCMPTCSYGIQKLIAEHYLRLWTEKSFITSTILRISNPYGVLLPPERKQGLIGVVLNRIKMGEVVEVYGNLNNVRDYIHVKDMAKMFEYALNERKGFQIYNVGSGKGYSVSDILFLIEKYTGQSIKKKIINSDNCSSLIDWVTLDINKPLKELGWNPLIDIELGIEGVCKKLYE